MKTRVGYIQYSATDRYTPKSTAEDAESRTAILKYLRSKGAEFTENPDGTVDIDGDVDLSALKLKKLPFQFGKVTGYFYCSSNRLTSLQGAPESVGRDFWCANNLLTSLQGAPKSVGGSFYCSNNRLTSLQGAPKSVDGAFGCSGNLDLDPAEVEAYLKKLGKGV